MMRSPANPHRPLPGAGTYAGRADCDRGDSVDPRLAAFPIARFQVKRQNERDLRYDLWMMRDAIDKYKDAADRGAFQTKVDSQNYPPDLETLVKGVDVQGKKVRFLRRIPGGPHDRQGGVGFALHAGRSRFGLLWRAKRFRRVFQVPGHGPGRHQVFRPGSRMAQVYGMAEDISAAGFANKTRALR